MPDLSDTRSSAAAALAQWFHDILDACDKSIFSAATSSQHRDVVWFETLSRNAKILVHGRADQEGDLYTPLCLALAAACRRLKLEISQAHWQSAIEGVLRMHAQTVGADLAMLGLAGSTPDAIFKNLMDEALESAGVTDRPTILTEENRQTALGMFVNWALRFLLSHALSTSPTRTSSPNDARDLAWIGRLLHSLAALQDQVHH